MKTIKNESSPKIFFIISCGRSGSTSLTKILNTATNAECLSEPQPALYVESRKLLDNNLKNPYEVIVNSILPRAAQLLDKNQIYGEKQLTLGPFIPYLHSLLKCKFIWLIRDGRDVVTSFLNWHSQVYGNIYRECKEEDDLSKYARKMQAPIDKDESDYARPRPGPKDPWFDEWANLSRFEMVAWYWAFYNHLIEDNLLNIPKEDWLFLNYSQVRTESILNVFDFLGLEGKDENKTRKMLNKKINSVLNVTHQKAKYPSWDKWDKETTNKFNAIAGKAMHHFGYYDTLSGINN
jgi:hypothetical protein